MAFSCCYVRLMSTTCVNAAREAHTATVLLLRIDCSISSVPRACLGRHVVPSIIEDTCCVMLCYVMLYRALLSGVMLGCDVWQT